MRPLFGAAPSLNSIINDNDDNNYVKNVMNFM